MRSIGSALFWRSRRTRGNYRYSHLMYVRLLITFMNSWQVFMYKTYQSEEYDDTVSWLTMFQGENVTE